jgi:hypothetical protein
MTHHNTLKIGITVIGLTFCLALVATSSHGKSEQLVKQLNVLGTAVIHQNNMVDGRQNAVNDALVSAVGQVVVEMLTGETVVRRFKLINDGILSQKDKYVQNYRVLTESVSGATIRTLVQVDVAVERVSRDLSRLGVALAGAVYPRILFMVAEKNVIDAEFVYWWGNTRLQQRTIGEGAMVETLQAIGFEIIDPPDLSAPLGLPVNASEADLLALAKRVDADVVIHGNGTAIPAPNTLGGAVVAFEAVVDAQAINVRTGRPIGRTRQKAVVSGQDAFYGGREALSGAGALAAESLAREIMIAWQEEQDRSALIEVVVEGTGGHIASFVRLRKAIATLSGVKELKMQEMSADQATMAVNYQGSTRSLADALLLKTFTGFGIDIYKVAEEAIHIRLVYQ